MWAEGVLDAFECVGWGGLLIGADGCVISLNREAQRHLGSGIALTQGRVAATHRPANALLQRLVADALSGGQGLSPTTRGGLSLPRRGGRPVMAYVMSVAESGSGSPVQARAIVLLIDSDKQAEPSGAILRDAFGLTPTEAQIAIGFARGHDLQEIASEKGLSIETVRKHFKEILAKTKTNRQAELAILLARLAQRPAEQFGVRSLRSGTLRSRPASNDRPVTVEFELVMKNLARNVPAESVIEQSH